MNICGGEDVERRFVGRESDHGSADASMLEEGYENVFPGEQEVEI
uniref:Uncharacterized protein n=1 Tax=Candidatus Methanogaster sp. ANME-2c ERB4 TaxID=2759911 RepID=A0A7G9Y769_9EURY|nr:hypothetical protein KKPOJJPN_00010 [Methanosarcinales archaeon ANME-2c ERB4]QNO46374.1 hypothetical protein KKGFGGCE_00012 [Methanosarcinales archaeon ANME-2c ERB4]